MTNQIIEVPDIAVVKTMDGAKKLLSLRDQKIKKDGKLHNFGAGSGVKYQGDLYVLDSGIIPIVRMTTSKIDPAFSVGKNGDIEVDWGDGTRGKKFTHTYTDGIGTHDIVFLGKNTALTSLWCADNQLIQLDVSQNSEMTRLLCSHNQLSQLDVSMNTSLTLLQCSSNQLSQLDVSKNTALTELYCYNNQLGQLDVSKNTALTLLRCSENLLIQLNISKNTALTELRCFDNQLIQLDVSQNTELTILRCYSNPLLANQSALTTMANSLPQREVNNKGEIQIYNSTSASWIQSICDEKNWTII